MEEAFKPERLEIDGIRTVKGVQVSAGVYTEADSKATALICQAPIGYARLFAASPELLTAVKRQGVHYDIINFVNDHLAELPADWHTFFVSLAIAAQANVVAARTAITKAEGKPAPPNP